MEKVIHLMECLKQMENFLGGEKTECIQTAIKRN